jgi:AraC-like DNA-binding protein
MDDYFRIEHEFYLDENNEYKAVLLHYQRSPDEVIDIDILPTGKPFLGMIINLSGHLVPYWIDDHRGSLGKAHYNFFYIPEGSSRWLLKRKMNSILGFAFEVTFLEQFVKDAPVLEEFLKNVSLNKATTLTPANPPLPTAILDGIIDLTREHQFTGKPREAYLRVKGGNLILAGIINSQRCNVESREAIEAAELHSIYQYMIDNLEHIRDTRPLVSLSKLSEDELKVKFKKLFGKTLTEALHDERLKKGEYLLTYTNMPVLEIGTHIGYTSRNSFSTAFHQRYGMYPKDFRNRFNKLGIREKQ